MSSIDLNSKVNLGSYLQKKNQLTNMFIQNQQDLDCLNELNKILQSDLETECRELEDLANQLKTYIKSRCQQLVHSI